MADLYSLIDEVKAEFPEFRLKSKSSSGLMKFLHVCLFISTFGRMKTFMTRYTTTVGYTIYTPDKWSKIPDRTKCIILRHERVHMRQRKRLGSIWFSFSYLLLPVPIFWAWYRMKYEMEAYAETIQAQRDYYGVKVFTMRMRESIIAQFTGAAYLWTWPWRKRIEHWYDALVSRYIDR